MDTPVGGWHVELAEERVAMKVDDEACMLVDGWLREWLCVVVVAAVEFGSREKCGREMERRGRRRVCFYAVPGTSACARQDRRRVVT